MRLQAFFFAFLATVAFGVLFQGPKRILAQSGVIGGIGWLFFSTLKADFELHSFAANFLASLVIALLSELAARLFKQPVTVFNVPAVIPLVPGLGMYQGMHYILNGAVSYGTEVLTGAALDACAIAIGLMMVSGAFRALKTGGEIARLRRQDILSWRAAAASSPGKRAEDGKETVSAGTKSEV